MAVTVSLRDGIEIGLSDGTRIVCDGANPDGDVAVISHAHGDHLPDRDTTAVCSSMTAALASERADTSVTQINDERIELRPAGHVAGSRAALITDPDGTRICYTGDVCTRDRRYLTGFDPPDADILVIEATYGKPPFEFPPYERVTEEILEWLRTTTDPVVLFGYALGRAQELQRLAMQADRDRILVTDAIQRVNRIIAQHLDIPFDVELYEDETSLRDGDALILPFQSTRVDWITSLVDRAGARTAGVSGWAIEESFRYRGDFDETFPLSDHCDYAELLDLVDAVDPETVYTHHGATDGLAQALTRRGYAARALRDGQTSLEEF